MPRRPRPLRRLAGSSPTPSSVTETIQLLGVRRDTHLNRVAPRRAGRSWSAPPERPDKHTCDARRAGASKSPSMFRSTSTAVAGGEVPHVPFERRLQAEVVEHARPQAEREIADRAEHVVDELLALGDRRADLRVAGRPGSARSGRAPSASAVSTCATWSCSSRDRFLRSSSCVATSCCDSSRICRSASLSEALLVGPPLEQPQPEHDSRARPRARAARSAIAADGDRRGTRACRRATSARCAARFALFSSSISCAIVRTASRRGTTSLRRKPALRKIFSVGVQSNSGSNVSQ